MLNKFRALLKIANAQIHTELMYRMNYLIGLLKTFIFISAIYFLWKTLYSNGVVLNTTYDLNSMLIYAIIGSGLRIVTSSFICYYISDLVRTGNISLELLKPISFQARLLFRTIGDISQDLIYKFSIISILTFIVFRVDVSVIRIINVAKFIPLMVCGALIIFLIDYIIGLLCFWLTDLWGVNFFKTQLITILSGALFPLWIYPAMFRSVIELTPFPYIFGYPLDVLIRGATAQEYFRILSIEFIWIAVLFLVGRLIWHKGSKQIFVQGG